MPASVSWPRELFQEPSASHRGRNKPRLLLGLGKAPPEVNVGGEPQLAVVAAVALNLIHPRDKPARVFNAIGLNRGSAW